MNTRARWTLATASTLLAVGLAGCGGGGAAAGATRPTAPAGAAASAGQHVTITANSSLRFAPMVVPVHTGTVQITLVDSGAYPHNLVIPGLHVTSGTVTGDPGGAQTVFTVTFAQPGTYSFHCVYHASAGMVGSFVVS
ncbi:MAG TPA: cupredoxin domain-containing protein [Mycobacteriales bacterium]|nr:cupredoxin domain-containing protein [Mycobacteriales bacterium]